MTTIQQLRATLETLRSALGYYTTVEQHYCEDAFTLLDRLEAEQKNTINYKRTTAQRLAEVMEVFAAQLRTQDPDALYDAFISNKLAAKQSKDDPK